MAKSNGAVPHVGPVQIPEIGGRVAKGAGDAAHRVAEAAEATGSRVAKHAESANTRVGRFRAKAGGQIGRAGEGLGGKQMYARRVVADLTAVARSRADAAASRARRKADAASVRLQLANTSRELAHETSDLGQAVESLSAIVKTNRKASVAKRRRLFVGIALGAGLAYHLDPTQGRQRRAATARLLTNAARSGLSKATAAVEASRRTRTRSA
jgi:hypothetical protein